MSTITLPNTVLEDLKCNFCNEYLSCFPVHSYANDGSITCGRCPLLQDNNPAHDIAYEKIAKLVIFPCKYKNCGCLEELTPNKLNIHEESCNFRQYFCPLIPLGTCSWQGPIDEMYEHFIEEHNSLVLNAYEFKIDMINRDNVNYIIRYDNHIFILHVSGDKIDDKLYISLRFLGHKTIADQYFYETVIFRLDMDDNMVFCKDKVQCDNEMNLNKNYAVDIKISDIKKNFANPLFVIAKITITNKNEHKTLEKTEDLIKDDTFNENIIKVIECPVCFNPMTPPIYQCVAGHSICNVCKSKVNDCPTCHADIENTRNFLLEEMTNHFKYPCKFRDYDCTYISTAQEIKQHELDCTFGPYCCPFKEYEECDWKDKLELLHSHVLVAHEDNLLDMDNMYICYYPENDENEDTFIIYKFKQVFKLMFKCDANFLYLNMQLIGPKLMANNYNYEIDFINQENNERIYFKKICCFVTNKTDAFQDDCCLKIPNYMIRSYIKDNVLNFKYRIFQNDD